MSSKELLSQDEIDALLHGVDLGDYGQGIEKAATSGEVALYDFFSQDRVVQGRMPALDFINERFACGLRGKLSEIFCCSVEVSVQGVQMLKFSEFMRDLPAAASLDVFGLKPLPGTALFVLDPALVYRAVECFFGGSSESPTGAGTAEYTPMERKMAQRLLEQSLNDLQLAWSPVFEINPEWLGTEQGPNIETLFDAAEVMVMAKFNLLFQGVGGDFQLLMPYAMLEPILDRLGRSASHVADRDDYGWQAAIHDSIQDARLELSSSLVNTTVTLRQLTGMQVGDVIPFEMPEQVFLDAEQTPLFRGVFGVYEGHYAVKIDACYWEDGAGDGCGEADAVGENHE